MILRAKTVGLLQTRKLTKAQKQNSKLNLVELKKKRKTLASYPRRIVLELTNACNLNCIMCGRNATKFNITSLNPLYLYRLEEALNVVEEVTLFGWGEPTIHPLFKPILKHLHLFPVRIYFLTNGMTLDKLKDAIFDTKIDIVAISLDGAFAKTNNRIRRGADFNKIIANIKDIVKERKNRKPYMNFVFTAMDLNLNEIPDMVRLTHKVGIEELKVVYLTVFSDNLLKQALWNKQDRVRAVFNKAEQIAKKLNIKLKLPYIQGEDIAEDKYHQGCFNGWRDFFLGSDGYVRACQSTSKKLFHITKYKTFMEMWNSKELRDFRAKVNTAKEPKECKLCYQSSHTNWNRKEAFIQTHSKFAPEWGDKE